MSGNLIYYSSQTENTHRFIQSLGLAADRIPMSPKDPMPQASSPYVLFVPTHGASDGRGAIPKQVARFLNDPEKRKYIRGVIASGNRNFGETYCLAGKLISTKCRVPLLYRFELLGTSDDKRNILEGLERFWKTQS